MIIIKSYFRIIKFIPRGLAAGSLAMGFPKGRGAARPFGRPRGSYPVVGRNQIEYTTRPKVSNAVRKVLVPATPSVSRAPWRSWAFQLTCSSSALARGLTVPAIKFESPSVYRSLGELLHHHQSMSRPSWRSWIFHPCCSSAARARGLPVPATQSCFTLMPGAAVSFEPVHSTAHIVLYG